MSKLWSFGYLLPHTNLREPVECGHFAIVPPDDERLIALRQSTAAVEALCGRFTDQFGIHMQPSAMLLHPDAPERVDYEQAVAFRNAVAVSSLIDASICRLSGGSATYPLWADYFDLYPFTVTRDGELYASSVASRELNTSENFCGQKAPYLATGSGISFGLDRRLLESLTSCWERRFTRGKDEAKTRRLFRSLEVALLASRVPAVGTRHPSIHDYGISIALWVSAFEILAHVKSDPTSTKRKTHASQATVLDLLEAAEWEEPSLSSQRYSIRISQKKKRKGNLVQKLYGELYRARNDFLHGNPVHAGNLFPGRDDSRPALMRCAPLIYRAALLAFAKVRFKKPKDVGEQVVAWMTMHRVQHKYEQALMTCRPNAS